MESQIKAEKNEINHFEGLVRQLPISKRDLASIKRKLDVNEKLYEFLLEKRANTSIAKSGIVPQTKIIEKARTVGVVGGKSNDRIFLFSGMGFLVALLLAIFIRLFFEKIQSVNELAENTKIPVLGGLASLKENNDLMDIKIRSKNHFVESLGQ